MASIRGEVMMSGVDEYGWLHPIFRRAKGTQDTVNDGNKLQLIASNMSKLSNQPKYQLRRQNKGRFVQDGGRYSRRVTVQSHIVKNHNRSSMAKCKQHLNYIQRDGAGLEGNRPELFNEEKVDDKGKSFIERSENDLRQFRFMLSPEDADQLDMHDFTQRFMEQMEKDLKTKLDWVASVHHNTNHPHAHINVRGRDKDGKELFISRDYMANGMRNRASKMVTNELGKRSEIEIENELSKAVISERYSTLDRSISKLKNEEDIVVLDEVKNQREHSLERRYQEQRLEYLCGLGLATKLAENTWKIDAHLKEILHKKSIQGDIVKMLNRDQRFQHENIKHFDPRSDANISGIVMKSGLKNEIKQERYVVINDEVGCKHYVEIGNSAVGNVPRVGDKVEIFARRPMEAARKSDENISDISKNNDGIYSLDAHKKWASKNLTLSEAALEKYLANHLNRARELEKVGVASKAGEGHWRVSDDLIKLLADKEKNLRYRPRAGVKITERARKNERENDLGIGG